MPIQILPTEMLQLIFGKCSFKEQKTISRVCHRWARAVEPLLLRASCLSLYSSYGGKTESIDMEILLNTYRQYRNFSIVCGCEKILGIMQILNEILDVCQERFQIQRLTLHEVRYGMLAQFFENRQDWLRNLVELKVSCWTEPGGCEISLPKLTELTWFEAKSEDFEAPVVVEAPELTRLAFESQEYWTPSRNHPLLSSLKLKAYSKLRSARFEGIKELHQRYVDENELLLQNLKELSFFECHSGTVQQICEKCTSLKELTIKESYGAMPLQISTILSPKLESLKLIGIMRCLTLYGEAIFPKLQHIWFGNVAFDSSACLVAPQLATFNAQFAEHKQLSIPHKDQIHTIRIHHEMVPPPPNVTELYMSLSRNIDCLPSYLKQFPNLMRLTLSAELTHMFDFSFVEHLPRLESFSANSITIKLKDLEKCEGLKSLILHQCLIEAQPDDEEIPLMALEYFRIDRVYVKGIKGYQFPIRVNERQSPIDWIGITARGYVYSSRNFKAAVRYEPVWMRYLEY